MEKENEIPEEEKNIHEQEEDVTEKVDKVELFEKVEENKEKEVLEDKTEENLEKGNKEDKNEEEVISNKEEKSISQKKKSKKAIIFIVLLIIILLILSTIFALTNIGNRNIIQGVYIEGIEISNLNKEELNQVVNDKISTIEEIELTYNEYKTIVKMDDVGIEVNGKEAIKDAIGIGKENNILIDNYNILKTKIFKTRLGLDITVNENKLKEMIKNIQAEMPEAMKEYSYEIKGSELIITPGKAGKIINEEELKQRMIENIKEQFNGKVNCIEIPTKEAKPLPIDIDKIYNEVHKEAKNAYIVEEPFELHKEEDGIDFKITIQEAKELLQESKETYKIPLKITKARVKVKDLGNKLFKHTLSKYTTIYDAGNANRGANIALAAKTINGTVLLPGETFSYNGILGNTTKEKGYKLGTAYVGGKTVPTYGGGICQVSSTLYNAVLYANLDIVERYNHSYSVSYVPAGRDATVSYGGKDFKFKNSRNYPIKIEANAKNGVVSISIKGIKEEKEYEIVLTSSVLSTTPCKTVYENNNNLAEGKQKVIQKGHTGQKSIAYKTVKYNGKTISKTVLSKDTYQPMNRIVQVGTKKTATKPSIAEPTAPTVPSTNVSAEKAPTTPINTHTSANTTNKVN